MFLFGGEKVPPEKSLKDFVLGFDIHSAYNEHSDAVTNYLISNISEFIDMILDANNGSIGINAVLLASNPQINLMRAMTQKGLIFTKITQLLNSTKDFTSKVAVRLCSIFTGIMQCDPEGSLLIPPFLLNFLRFADNAGIRSLFEYIFSPDSKAQSIQNQLAIMNLPQLFLSIIEEAEKEAVEKRPEEPEAIDSESSDFENNQYSYTPFDSQMQTSHSFSYNFNYNFFDRNSAEEYSSNPIRQSLSFPTQNDLQKIEENEVPPNFKFETADEKSNFVETRSKEDVAYLSCSLLRIAIHMTRSCRKIRKQFLENFCFFEPLLQNPYPFVVNELILLCNELLNEEFQDNFKNIINYAWIYLVEGSDKLTELTISSLEIITNSHALGIIKFRNDYHRLFEIIIRLCAQFPDSPFVLSKICKLIKSIIADKMLNNIVFEELIPAMVDFATDGDHRTSRIYLITLLDEVKNKSFKTKNYKNLLKSSDKISYFFNSYLPSYIIMLNTPYGGPIRTADANMYDGFIMG